MAAAPQACRSWAQIEVQQGAIADQRCLGLGEFYEEMEGPKQFK